METTENKLQTIEFKQSYFQASVVLADKVISTVLVRDFLTSSYYLSTLKRLHSNELRYYYVTTYYLTSQQCKEINNNYNLLGYDYFSTLR